MRIAAIADVHANREALQTVLDDIEERGVDLVICLGDIVGYNAEPTECIEIVQARCDLVVAGNHDVACVKAKPDPGTNPVASEVQAWTRAQLHARDVRYLGGLPNVQVHEAGFVMAHACYLNEHFYTGYVTSTMLEANFDALGQRPAWPRIAFCGHTHVQMCAWRYADIVTDVSLKAAKADGVQRVELPPSAATVLVNPGAVGQSRDGNAYAGYAIVDLRERIVEMRRIPYAVAETCASIRRAGLPEELITRLQEGR